MRNDISVISLDGSFFLMLDLLGNIFFYEKFIVFFFICIKVSFDLVLRLDLIVEFGEGVNDLVGVTIA